MLKSVSTARFEALKRQAKRFVRNRQNLTHSQALDELARAEGFGNWSLLAKGVEHGPSSITTENAPVAQNHTVRLLAYIASSDPTVRWSHEEQVATRYPSSRYESFRWIEKRFTYSSSRDDRPGLLAGLAKAKRAISFMDRTGLKPSRAWRSVFRSPLIPPGFDHTCVWRDEMKRIIITTEPYFGADRDVGASAACDKLGWPWVRLPKRTGIWFPCRESCPAECSGHTIMYVTAPAKNGGDPKAIAAALESSR